MLTRSQYLSGKVRRWHTHHDLTQTNADHSWGVAMVLLHIHPNPSMQLIKAALEHDCGEYLTGDTPGYAKIASQVLKEELDRLEVAAMQQLGFDFPHLELEDAHWLSLADAIEAILFVRHCGKLDTADLLERFPALVEKARKYADLVGFNLSNAIEGSTL